MLQRWCDAMRSKLWFLMDIAVLSKAVAITVLDYACGQCLCGRWSEWSQKLLPVACLGPDMPFADCVGTYVRVWLRRDTCRYMWLHPGAWTMYRLLLPSRFKELFLRIWTMHCRLMLMLMLPGRRSLSLCVCAYMLPSPQRAVCPRPSMER